jgi:DNA invertase Pin-like site-specific DNA recombinase
MSTSLRVALYGRVSTSDQNTSNQVLELERYVASRGWTIVETFLDEGVSGAKESRPALDALMKAARRRRIDAVVVWRLDRLGRNLRHLLLTLETLNALGVAFISLSEGIDCTTAAGRLQMQLLGAFAEFERERIRERVRAGLARVKAQGRKLGRPRRKVDPEALQAVRGLPVRAAASRLGVSVATAHRMLANRQEPQRLSSTG